MNPGASFTWVSRVAGVRVTARHTAEETGAGTRVTLWIRYAGWGGYHSINGLRTAELMELDERGKVRRVLAHYHHDAAGSVNS